MKILRVDCRGRLTLPKSLRRALGSEQGKIMVDLTKDGVLLRPVVEMYSERRIREFHKHNEEELTGFRRLRSTE